MAIRKNILKSGGKTSFYGMQRHVRTSLSPKTGIKAPINDLCGPHIALNQSAPYGRASSRISTDKNF